MSEARGPSLYVGDCTLKAWFAEWRGGNQAGGATRKTWWTEGGHQQVCVMWPRLSFGNDRIPEGALIEALSFFPVSRPVMWMLTPTVRGTNMAAMQQEYSDGKKVSRPKTVEPGEKGLEVSGEAARIHKRHAFHARMINWIVGCNNHVRTVER